MKRLFAVVALVVLASPMANADLVRPAEVLRAAALSYATSPVSVMNLINWKVGDTATYDVSAESFGDLGTNTKTVTKDDGDGTIWVEQVMNLSVQKETVDMQLNKADGKVLKLIENGQEAQIPDDKINIISQDYTTITVKAGTFKCLHIVGSTSQAPKLEVWANPTDTVMDGSIKEIIQTSMLTMTMELTSFKKMP